MKLLLPASLLSAALVLSGCVVQPSGHDVAYGDPGYGNGNGGYNDHYDNGGYNHHHQSGHQTNVYETNVTENNVTENNVTRQNRSHGGSYSQSHSAKAPAARPNPGHPQKASPPHPHPQQHPQQHPQSTNNQGNGKKKKHPDANSNNQN
ncbi:MAG TPA: hypothetical protein VNB29_06515 [Chthoniobacterales bacterium]|nr:hypothetical protein [Chthoniobacterales bacterium]